MGRESGAKAEGTMSGSDCVSGRERKGLPQGREGRLVAQARGSRGVCEGEAGSRTLKDPGPDRTQPRRSPCLRLCGDSPGGTHRSRRD